MSKPSRRPHPRPRAPLARSLSQHRLRSVAVARRIVSHTGLARPGLVYEVGAGEGTLTAALAERAGRVVAVEAHRRHWEVLRRRFAEAPNIEPVLGDFLALELPREGIYAVAGNAPFSITAALVRKLLAAPNPPRAAYLVVQREAALHWAGFGRESVAGVLAKVRFAFDVPLALRRHDFVPPPAVECVLLSMERRPRPLLAPGDEARFRTFVERGFGGGRSSLRRNLGRGVGYRAFRNAARDLGFHPDAAPGELSFDQWLGLWRAVHER